jgi:hypothetical protein
MTDNSTDTTVDSMLAEMLSAENVRNAFNIGQRRIENVGWYDFSYYEFFMTPKVFRIDTSSGISASAMKLIDNLNEPSIPR